MTVGYLPIMTAATGEVITAERLNRYCHDANVIASRKSQGIPAHRTVAIGGNGIFYWWVKYQGEALHYRIRVTALGAGTWGMTVNGTPVISGQTSTGVRTTDACADGVTANQSAIDLSGLGLTLGAPYVLAVVVAGASGAVDVTVQFLYTTGAPAGTAWAALPALTDGVVLTAAHLDLLRADLGYLLSLVDVPRVPGVGRIHEQEAYNDWAPGDSDLWRAGYHYDNHYGAETEFWAGWRAHQSDTLAIAIQAWVKTTDNDTHGRVRVYANGTLVCSLTAVRLTANPGAFAYAPGFGGLWSTDWSEPGNAGAVTVYATVDISPLGLAEGAWYEVRATYQMDTGGAGAWDVMWAPPDRLDASIWYAEEVDGDIPAGYTPPPLWEVGDYVRGTAVAGEPSLSALTAAMADLYTRTAGYPALACYQLQAFQGAYWQHRRTHLEYSGAGVVLGYGGDVTSVDPARPPESVTLPLATPGLFSLAGIPIGDLVVSRADAPGPPDYLWELDL